MKKYLALVCFLGALLNLSPVDLMADRDYSNLEDNYLSISVFTPFGLGYKHNLSGNFFLVTDLGYEKKDLRLRAGASYFFPFKVLIFRPYTGAGFQYSRNDGYQYPYLTIGIRFLIAYFEIVHPWEKDLKPDFRLGLSFSF
jgi:hypothetical protein